MTDLDDAHDVDEISVPGAGVTTAIVAVLLWAFVLVYLFSDDLPVALPPWAPLAALAASPLIGVFALWSLVTRRIIVASPDGVRVTRWPIALWDAAWVERGDLVTVSIEEREDDDDESWLGRRPSKHWAVVAVTHEQGTVTLATRFLTADGARNVAERIRRATGVDMIFR
jgi:hypothetical protein